jgi:hypothetical protein
MTGKAEQGSHWCEGKGAKRSAPDRQFLCGLTVNTMFAQWAPG